MQAGRAIVATAVTAGTLAGASLALGDRIAREVRTQVRASPGELTVLGADVLAEWVDLQRCPATLTAGHYGLRFAPSDARQIPVWHVGEILSVRGDVVRRALVRAPSGGEPVVLPTRGDFVSWLAATPEEWGVRSRRVIVEGALGEYPADYVAGHGSSASEWAVLVHGRGVGPSECYRMLPLLHELGMSALVVSVRNDGTGPWTDHRQYGLGAAESIDVEAAIAWAASQGAHGITLFGWSMGGAASLQVLRRVAQTGEPAAVRAAVLDSPAVDWREVIASEVSKRGVPGTFGATVGGTMLGQRVVARPGRYDDVVPMSELDVVSAAAQLDRPVLVQHSVDDTLVPIGGSRALASARPDLVSLVEYRLADHVRLSNVWPEHYFARIRAFLASVVPSVSDV